MKRCVQSDHNISPYEPEGGENWDVVGKPARLRGFKMWYHTDPEALQFMVSWSKQMASATSRLSAARNYWVVSRELSAVDVICDDGTGPLEYWREVLCVRASSRQRAKILALRCWRRRRGQSWKRYNWIDDGGNPFTGLIVEPVEKLDA